MPAGRYDAVRRILSVANDNEPSLGAAPRARLEYLRGVEAYHDGHQSGAVDAFERAARSYRALGDVRSTTEMLANSAMALADLGVLDQAAETLTSVVTTADRMGLSYLSAYATCVLGQLHILSGRSPEGRQATERAIALARQQGDPRIEGCCEVSLCLDGCIQGRLAEAELHGRKAVSLLEKMPPLVPAARAALAKTLLLQARADEALVQAREAYRLLEEQKRVEDGEALIRLVYAESLLAVGREEEARATIDDAADRLIQRASKIEQPAWRETFLGRIRWHADTLAAARRFGDLSRPGP
jgi:tetratricopeptide (TPR) repeat protein